MPRDQLFEVFLFLRVIVVPCVLFYFDWATHHKEDARVLTRYSPENRPERTCYYLVGARTARTARATLSDLHCACASIIAVEVVPPHTGGGYPTASSVLLCGLARTVRATLSALHCASAPTLAVSVVSPQTGGGHPTASSVWAFCCTEWVNGPSDLSLLRERS